MIYRSVLPRVTTVLVHLGIQPGRHNRSRCPIHRGDNPTAVSFDDNEGLWYCHRCGTGGDVINLVEQTLKTDFKGALLFLGMQRRGKRLKPNLDMERRRAAVEKLREWCSQAGRALRDQYLHRQRITRYAQEKLQADPEDELAWNLLALAFDGEARNEFLLDEIDLCRTDNERLRAWREYHDDI